ncbi:MAG: isochorismatase family protein [Chloroflexi bacterium]|nr:isochorismatase family protein [Chloroflexota bacterium]
MAAYDAGCALLVVDMQNDFAHPDGALSVAGALEIVPLINAEVEDARAGQAMVVYTQDWHPPETPHFKKDGGIWPVHCVRDTWGAALLPELEQDGPVVRKGSDGEDGYSGFTMRDPASGEERPTELHALLQKAGVGRIVIVGLASDYCVKESALDAVRLGLEVDVVEAAVRAVNLQPDDGRAALAAMRAAGVHLR